MNKLLQKSLILVVLFDINLTFGQMQAPASTLHSESLHTAKPDYSTPYGSPKVEDIMQTLGRIRSYLDTVTPHKSYQQNHERRDNRFLKN